MSEPRQRAAHLLRWYPRAWRARYGEEFTELLLADLAERSRSAARTADVIRGGLVARLADAGLCGCAPQVPELARAQARASLASLACCAAVFLGVGGAIWGQLVIGWQWSAPATAGTVVATFVMTGTVLVLALLTLLAALPVAWTVATRLAGGRARGLAVPSALFLAGLVIMIVGGRHFGNGWPGTGGHPWARTGLVPGGVAAFCWACTLSVSSFWAHPAALAAFPAAELTWMTLSPIAFACLVAGAATTVRRAELSPALLRFEGRLGVAACVTMAVFLGGGCAWLAGRAAPPGSPFRPGAIDVAGLAVMALALAVAASPPACPGRCPVTPWTRRRVLTLGLAPAAVLACVGVGGAELVSRGVLPGRTLLDRLDGACSVPAPPLVFAPPGPAAGGTFYSASRRRTVGFTIAYPPGHRPGDRLPLVVMLHAYGGNHADALAGMSPAQAVALKPGGRPLVPMAMVTVDGGDGYWNPHPGDDPMAMVIGELIPRCQRLGLGRPPRRIAVMGTSMGGFGALMLAENYPRLFAAVAAVSPAVWTSYPQARQANPGAFASAAAFAAGDVIAHASALGRRPVRIASAYGDPFYPGVRTLARALPAGAVAVFGPGCHNGSFFAAQEPPSLAFLASHLA